MEAVAVPEEKEMEIQDRPFAPKMDINEILELQEGLGGCTSRDPFVTLALACSAGDKHAVETAGRMVKKQNEKGRQNLLEMQKRQDEGAENIRAGRGKRTLENECS